MKPSDEIKLKIESFDVNGYGVAKYDNKVIFVMGAMEGEEVIAKIVNVHKKYAFAEVVTLLSKSKDRIDAKCPYYEYCGGCDTTHMTYACETKIKHNKVAQTLKSVVRQDFNVSSVITNNNINGYRNKVMIPFMKDEEDGVLYGFYEKKSHNIVSIDKCLISNDLTNEITSFVCKYLNVMNVSIYNEEEHKGLFKELMIRHTALDEYMVVLVTTAFYDFTRLVNYLVDMFPQIKSIYLNINSDKTNVVLSNNYKLIYGKKTITEDILGLKFNVSPASFMQVNHDQCEKLYQKALDLANLNGNMNVIDAYCGMGSITLNIAKKVNKVYGIEVVEDAIKNANENKELNGINNAHFICGKCEDEIVRLINKEKIDVIFFDPPRKGCEQKFLDTVIKMQIPKIIYISCGISSLARDLKYLLEHGYEVKQIVPTDLFSRTNNIETICLLSLKDIHN
jgi:23S rRNA (uracil1939-C5)-methyltransferase